MSVLAWLIPVFGVEDLERSTRFYTEGLGFRVAWTSSEVLGRPASVHLRHGAVELMLYGLKPGAAAMQDRSTRKKMWIQVAVSDPARWRRILAARGITWREPPNAGHFFEVEDPDGYLLRFSASMGVDELLRPIPN